MENLWLHCLPLLLWACIPCQVQSSAVVSFEFRSWRNPTHRDLSGKCCDDIIGFCDDLCDNYFIVCLDDSVYGSDDMTLCSIQEIKTDVVFQDNDDFNFPGIIPPGISKRQQINVDKWLGWMRVNLQVWDMDPNNDDDKVAETDMVVTQMAARSQSDAVWLEYKMGTQNVFRFRVSVFCNSNYYGADCSEYCVPADNQNGHYACDPTTGAKICHSGWGGENCDVDIDECASGPCLNGATCVNEINGFLCICAQGWEGQVCSNATRPDDGNTTPGYTTSSPHDSSSITDANAGDYFYCSDGRYIPMQWSCDRIIDCVNGEDELRHCGLAGGAKRKRDSDPA